MVDGQPQVHNCVSRCPFGEGDDKGLLAPVLPDGSGPGPAAGRGAPIAHPAARFPNLYKRQAESILLCIIE